ncbi:MAG: helix-turn-helix transcriptional regulator [Clostridia bacterium]|nr:helix-turn-helix transcriptional regulator [Clostridia bacterium]
MHESQYKMNLIKVGLKIAYYRKLQGMTQEELAEACDLSAGYISQLEGPNCYFCPSLKTLFVIAEVLSVPAYKFLDIDD